MTNTSLLTIYTDGAARGNPGPAAFAYVMQTPDGSVVEDAGRLGRMTNNQAEYLGLVRALEHALQLGPHHRLVIHSDSELMVKQMNGEYRVKNEDLRSLYDQAQNLRARFPSVVIRHVRRNQNKRADQLCNDALDGKRDAQQIPALKAELPNHPAGNVPASPSDAMISLNSDAVAHLRAAAASWARGDPNDPDPSAVWKQLRDLIKRTKAQRRRSEPRS